MPGACHEPRRRGGSRPGAGAPRACPEPGRRRNLNAVKHGSYSPKFQALVDSMAKVPELRDIFLEFRRHELRRQRRARSLIKSIFVRLLLQLKAHPDPEINRTITTLLHRFQASNAAKNEKTIYFQAQTIKPWFDSPPVRSRLTKEQKGGPLL